MTIVYLFNFYFFSKRERKKQSNLSRYQKNSCLRKVARYVVTNILGHTTKLVIVKPLISMEIAHNIQTFGSIVLLYLIN